MQSIDEVQSGLGAEGYVCGRALATVVFLALKLGRPLFLEGEAGVGKTEIAKALAAMLGRKLIRLQCYEGLDASSAVYEWNFAAQMVAIRTAEASGGADRQALQTELFPLAVRNISHVEFKVPFVGLGCLLVPEQSRQ